MSTDGTRARWIVIGLLVSLGLNLFLGGLVVGRWVGGPPRPFGAERQSADRAPSEPPGRLLMQRMARSLPPEQRAVFEAAVARHRDEIAAAAGRVREARVDIREALLREPFDRAALDAAFAALRRRSDELSATIQGAIGDAAAELPQDARRRLAEWRREPPHEPRGRP